MALMVAAGVERRALTEAAAGLERRALMVFVAAGVKRMALIVAAAAVVGRMALAEAAAPMTLLLLFLTKRERNKRKIKGRRR